MHFAVIQFPGSNCDADAVHVVDKVLAPLGSTGRLVWHKEHSLGAADAVILPGGFSYGDYLRAGAMAAHCPIMASVKEFAAKGGPVLAICNGFQVACEARLLEGALLGNVGGKFECRDVYLRVEGKPTPFTQAIPAGRALKMGIAHHDGRYMHPDMAALEASGQVVFRYATSSGEVNESVNPNGSMGGIAGVCNEAGNVVGLMPHPERACEAILGEGSVQGRALFESALMAFQGKTGRVEL